MNKGNMLEACHPSENLHQPVMETPLTASIDLWTDICKFQYASTIPDCTISMFQSVIKLFQIYEFFDCKYQLAYQRSRSAQPKLTRGLQGNSLDQSA
ncbi:hypothetical protein F2Q69_00014490 [Brassica cretica]|uniref:Uncharacterized protein n=1 Tax=Brassica cretica TaxID=69181 RepID=A0A8S9R3W9_BRACR|nr:hypothetical protein F2Q69_00014490 [Brassica cretica]